MSDLKQWQTVCSVSDLVEHSGVCALLPKDKQVAIFSLPNREEKVFAIDNFDPIGQANVLYRGITGCNDGEPIVASPLYKQQFSLKTGKCIQEDVEVVAYPARIEQSNVQILI